MIIGKMKNDLAKFAKNHPFVFFCLVFYLGGLAIFCVGFADRSESLSLNAAGDFLAGAFSPLAFLFLYMGYRQNSKALHIQAEELKQNTEALRLQVQEMKESVLQQTLLVEAATEDLNLAKLQHDNSTIKDMVKSQPFIHLHAFAFKWVRDDSVASIQALNDREFDNIKIEISFVNSRTLARELILRIKNKNMELYGWEEPIFKTTETMKKITLELDYPKFFLWEHPHILDVQFSYLDEIDKPQFQYFKIELFQDAGNRSQPTKVIRGETSFQKMD